MKKVFIGGCLLLFLVGCVKESNNKYQQKVRTFSEITNSDTLNILTLYSSTSYFIYKGEEMGYEFELARSFAHHMGLYPKIIVASNIHQLTEKLLQGEGDLIAYPMPRDLDNDKMQIIYCGDEKISSQVLVQRASKNIKLVTDVTQLVDKKITVEKGTKYHKRLENLNKELGGGIIIDTLRQDSLTSEDLIYKVASGEIEYTLADDDVAKINKTYYKNLNIDLKVSFSQRSSWVVSSFADTLSSKIDKWFAVEVKQPEYSVIAKRYFEKSKAVTGLNKIYLKNGKISEFDDIFKQCAKSINWDWRLVAAIAYEESQFDPNAISWAGARGLMQLMPNTAENFGLAAADFTDPLLNVETCMKLLGSLQKRFDYIPDDDERMRFVLGSFHAGLGHIVDAISLAKKYGYDTNKWEKNVATCLTLKSNPQYYNDSIVKLGYFPGYTTLEHVNGIIQRYDSFKDAIKE